MRPRAQLLDAEVFDDDFLPLWTHGPRDADQEAEGIATILAELDLDSGRVLDLCGGFGRVGGPLATNHGYDVDCLDASDAMLEHGRTRWPNLRFIRDDARTFATTTAYDAVINVFQSFGYFATDAEHINVLRRVSAALRPGGAFVMDVINRDYVATMEPQRLWHRLEDGRVLLQEVSFDAIAGRSHETVRIEGEPRTWSWSMRIFNLTDISRMLDAAGLVLHHVDADYQGTPFDAGEPMMVIVAVAE